MSEIVKIKYRTGPKLIFAPDKICLNLALHGLTYSRIDKILDQGSSQKFAKVGARKKSGVEILSVGYRDRSPVGSGTNLPEAGDKYGCRLHRYTMKNAKHTNTEITTKKTMTRKIFYL